MGVGTLNLEVSRLHVQCKSRPPLDSLIEDTGTGADEIDTVHDPNNPLIHLKEPSTSK